MNPIKFYISTLLVICLVYVITAASKDKDTQQTYIPETNAEAFALMELFTSQGCSSCPPADNLLGKYADMHNEHIIALAFHVDYWNRLGWTDSFSSPKYSRRQRDYAMVIDHSSVYTPQLVINGETELIGSDAGKVSDAVSKALKGRAAIVISIDKIEKSGKDIMVNYTLDKTFPNLTMQAALVQKEVVTNILKGENRGLKLTNYNVVRDFNSDHISNTSSGIHLNLPTGAHDNDFAIVLFIQDDASGKVIGVIQKKL